MPPAANRIRTVKEVIDALFPPPGKGDGGRDMSAVNARAAYAFESLVLELLRLHLEKADPRARMSLYLETAEGRFDAIAPGGVDDLPGPCAADVMVTFDRAAGLSALSVHGRVFRAVAAGLGSLLIIGNVELKGRTEKTIESAVSLSNGSLTLGYWGPAKLQAVVDDLGEPAQLLLANFAHVHIASAVIDAARGRPDRWKDQRSALIAELHRAWETDNLALFLGAGVSMDAGVPGWNKLLGRLFSQFMTQMDPLLATDDARRDEAAARLLSLQSSSPLMTARNIRSGLDKAFFPAIRDALYAEVGDRCVGEQLAMLAELCTAPRGRFGVRSVVTYNFDELLERQLRNAHVKFTTISRIGERAEPNSLPVYHVHGYIPYAEPLTEESARQLIVFSEEAYHSTYNEPYTWSNVVQLNILSDQTCVFVGLSMTDPNLRRLLEIAAKAGGQKRHVALLRRVSSEEIAPKRECPLEKEECAKHKPAPVDAQTEDVVLAAHHKIWEDSLLELGVRILWYEHHREIPSLLAKIVDPAHPAT